MISYFHWINSCQTWLVKTLFFVLVTGDVIARNSSWWKNDCVTREGTEIVSRTCSYGMSQLIFYSTHVLQISSSCIDLVSTNQQNFVINSGVHSSLHPNCHHQIAFSKINIKIDDPPFYERLVRDYINADSKSINEAIEMFNWEKLFQNKNILDKLKLFNETIFSIVYNYISNKCNTYNDKDPRVSLTKKIVLLTIKIKYLRSNSRMEDLIFFTKTCKP